MKNLEVYLVTMLLILFVMATVQVLSEMPSQQEIQKILTK